MDIMKLMKEASSMQEKLKNLQDELATVEATGEAGAGLVKVTLNGQTEMTGLVIDPSAISSPDDAEMLEDMIVAAHRSAKKKLTEILQEKQKELMGGLSLPPGMNIPGF